MLSEGVARPLRVEQALRLVPELEVLAPLRALLVSTSQPDDARAWASSGPYRTVGKRHLELAGLRREASPLLRRIGEHVSALYESVVEALEKEVRGEGSDAIRALVRGGEREESVGRCVQALAWYALAVEISEGLNDRAVEIEALLKLGALCEHLARYGEGARSFQRAFVLAEAEFDTAATLRAAQGLGDIALAQGSYGGAESWYSRGLSLAEAASDDLRVAELHRGLAEALRRKGDVEGAA
ncbi:MAG: tetratricopeptide repeat protein, partial [Gemmatimonadota bacterium]